ncbi:MAG: glycosyltransferase [Verrucomicrobiae bacterium]|nr:glycosyltransferase [Verrucomicrobiae bacterium]
MSVPEAESVTERTASRRRVALVLGGHLSSCPRAIKEADALAARGHEALILGSQTLPAISEIDGALERRKPWAVRHARLHSWGAARRAWTGFQRRRARAAILEGDFSEATALAAFAPWAEFHLREIARFRPALLVGHTLPGLVVGWIAHRRFGIPWVFDLEDFHPGEREGGLEEPENCVAHAALKAALPTAAAVIAASPFIAAAATKAYARNDFAVILNCFPSEPAASAVSPPSARVSLAWFSQTVGLDRGLGDALDACARLKGDFDLHLRGSCSTETALEILERARRGGFLSRCHLHPWGPPDGLAATLAPHTVGLALETGHPPNRDLCITNKILLYPLAGLAVAATRTAGQQWVMEQAPDMGFVYAPGDAAALACGLQRWLDDPAALALARAAARRAAETVFSWEKESRKLLALLEGAMA